MATIDEAYLAMEIQSDLIRLLPNVFDLISIWRSQLASEQLIGVNMTEAARGFLGRLRRLAEYATQETNSFNEAIAPLGITRAHLNSRVTALRDALRIFRDATKSNISECIAALDALEAAVPAPKRFLNQALPTDW